MGALLGANGFVIALREPGDLLRGTSLAMVGGVISGNMFFEKITAELVKNSASGGTWAIWTNPVSYAMVLGASTFGISNVYFLSKALSERGVLCASSVFSGTERIV